MRVLYFLLVPILIAAAIIGLNVWRQRRPRSIEASVREFRDGLDALDPANATKLRQRPTQGANRAEQKRPEQKPRVDPKDQRTYDRGPDRKDR
jgi:hypothetical protein